MSNVRLSILMVRSIKALAFPLALAALLGGCVSPGFYQWRGSMLDGSPVLTSEPGTFVTPNCPDGRVNEGNLRLSADPSERCVGPVWIRGQVTAATPWAQVSTARAAERLVDLDETPPDDTSAQDPDK